MQWRHWQPQSQLPGVVLSLYYALVLHDSLVPVVQASSGFNSSTNNQNQSLTCQTQPWEVLEQRCFAHSDLLERCDVKESSLSLELPTPFTSVSSAADFTSQEYEVTTAPPDTTQQAIETKAPSIELPISTTSTLTDDDTVPSQLHAGDTATSQVSPSTPSGHDTPKTEIDESFGQSWSLELEDENERIQTSLQEHNQAPLTDDLAQTPLSTSTSSSPNDSDIPDFPSFEEWKQRHLAANVAGDHKRTSKHDGMGQFKDGRMNDSSGIQGDIGGTGSAVHSTPHDDPFATDDSTIAAGANSVAIAASSQRILQPIPHAGTGDPLLDPLIPLRDRTNYASFDCSATLIRASKLTKSASAILSSKKDRYMLTPCAEKEKFVIVELCDEIQIDTIVLANLEFFSSMFKMFRVSGGTAYPDSSGTWHDIGTFRAGNARGMQVFRPLEPSKGGFYRYIRIDFVSHYGTEYYCPVSLLKVYGLTQLDAYRRDEDNKNRLADADEEELLAHFDYVPQLPAEKEEVVYLKLVDAEPRTSLHPPSKISNQPDHPAVESTQEPFVDTPSATLEQSLTSSQAIWSTSISVPPSATVKSLSMSAAEASQESPTATSDATSAESATSSLADDHTITKPPLAHSTTASQSSFSPASASASPSESSSVLADTGSQLPRENSSVNLGPDEYNATSQSNTVSEASPVGTQKSIESISKEMHKRTASTELSPIVYKTVSAQANQAAYTPSSRRNDSRAQVIYTHNQGSHPQPNESIYGTIMKRLLALEVNTTLSTAYVEEHSRMVWETFRRIEERLTNIEKSRSRYDQLLRRIMLDLDLHRAKLEAERLEMIGQLSVLSREMVTEKRLGIAQLFALVVLLFFVVLTRGSPSSPLLSLTDPRSAASTISPFPKAAKSRRPRSLRDEPLDHFSSVDFRTLPSRDRRGVGSDKRNSWLAGPSSTGISRNTSVKRPYRTSNNMTKRPSTAVPLRRNGFDGSPPWATTSPQNLPLSAPLLETNSLSGEGKKSRSREATPVAIDLNSRPLSPDGRTSPADLTIRSSTPPLYPVLPKQRRSPVEALRQKLRLMQPRRSASLDETTGLPMQGTTSSASVLDRRKHFSLGLTSSRPARARSHTINSMTSEEGVGEGTSRAWLSTSEDSGGDDDDDDTSGKAYTGVGVSSFAQLLQDTSAKNINMHLPPSPDPSDAERSPVPNNLNTS